jgi:hypothetical protein
MLKEKSKIFVRDIHTQHILFECFIDESDKAYRFAAEMEELGLDIEVVSPTLSEGLSASLGLSKEQLEHYKESMDEEIEAHEGSCCFEEADKKNKH